MERLPSKAVTLEEFCALIDHFVSTECEKQNVHLIHKKCGGAIRVGFINLFHLNDDGSLDPGPDGSGIGPKRLPYCENCNPPHGFNHPYTQRLPIKRQPTEEFCLCGFTNTFAQIVKE